MRAAYPELEMRLDKETCAQKREHGFDAPDDAEVYITFGTLRMVERMMGETSAKQIADARIALELDAKLTAAAFMLKALDEIRSHIAEQRLFSEVRGWIDSLDETAREAIAQAIEAGITHEATS